MQRYKPIEICLVRRRDGAGVDDDDADDDARNSTINKCLKCLQLAGITTNYKVSLL